MTSQQRFSFNHKGCFAIQDTTLEDAREISNALQQVIKDMDKLEEFTTQDNVESTANNLQDLPKRTVDPEIQGLLDRVQELENEVAELQSKTEVNEVTQISDGITLEYDAEDEVCPVRITVEHGYGWLRFEEVELLRSKLAKVLD